ncbi:MAG: HAD-IA family hydrolase [Candidatus Heimdallarchaeota archaeon]|nr:HAD-IA family hydrolase [Candidatus Heimdallarchaeota archaeon]
MVSISTLLQKWNISCVIFDLDGTLTDTLDLHVKAFQILFQELNISIPKDKIEENMGRTPKDTLKTLVPQLVSSEKKLELLADKKEHHLRELLEEIKLFPGAQALIKRTKKLVEKICLASSTPKENVLKILRETSLEKKFDVIVTGEEITIGKPDPQIFEKAAKKANKSRKECLVIGDSTHDILAAKQANMKIIAVTTGKHSPEQLKRFDPNIIINSLTELLNQ